jgi:hypothetical protein
MRRQITTDTASISQLQPQSQEQEQQQKSTPFEAQNFANIESVSLNKLLPLSQELNVLSFRIWRESSESDDSRRVKIDFASLPPLFNDLPYMPNKSVLSLSFSPHILIQM